MKHASLRRWFGTAIDRWAATAAQRDAVYAALQREGFPLAPGAPHRFATMTVAAFEAGGGRDKEVAVAAGGSIELLMAAGYSFDHVIDGDVPARSAGDEALVGLTILFLAQSTLADVAERALGRSAATLLMQDVTASLRSSAAGQLDDVRLANRPASTPTTTDEASAMTELKAGPLGHIAGSVGARLATASRLAENGIAEALWYFATYRQMIDDLSDVEADAQSSSRTGAQGRATLPLVYLRNFLAANGGLIPLQNGDASPRIMGDDATIATERGSMSVDEMVRASGAAVFTQLNAEVMRKRALEAARAVEGAQALCALIENHRVEVAHHPPHGTAALRSSA